VDLERRSDHHDSVLELGRVSPLRRAGIRSIGLATSFLRGRNRSVRLGIADDERIFFPPDLFRIDTSVTVIRPDDLLVLTFDRINLGLDTSGPVPKLVRAGEGAAYLIVGFPPQHIVEQAYFESAEDDHLPFSPPTPSATELAELSPSEQATLVALRTETPPTEEDPPDPPIPARIAGPSRLVFRVRDEDLPIDFTLEKVLGTLAQLPLSVPINALPPAEREIAAFHDLFSVPFHVSEVDQVSFRVASPVQGTIRAARALRKARLLDIAVSPWMATGLAGRGTETIVAEPFSGLARRPTPQPPSPEHTSIELPYRLIVSPTKDATWFHDAAPVTSETTNRTELWHTRLGVVVPDVDGPRRTEEERPERVIRAVWTRDVPPPQTPVPQSDGTDPFPDAIPGHSTSDPFRASLDAFDRHNIVHLSSNFALDEAGASPGTPYEPQPVAVRNLMLSSLGGWLDSRGAWDFPQPYGLSVEEWRHRATMGRDHYVRVVYAGHLLPFGHRTSLIKISERKVHEDRPGDPAFLRQRMYLVVREPIRSYLQTGWMKGIAHLDHMWPFETVRITNLVSPNLDMPEGHDIANAYQSCFWPYVGGHPHLFNVVATDRDGNPVHLSVPAIFVDKGETDKPFDPGSVGEAIEEYNAAPDGGRVVDAGGQKIAFADPSQPNDTAFAVETITIGAEYPDSPAYDDLAWSTPRYVPVMRRVSIRVPAMQRIAKTSQAASMVYAPAYLEDEGEFSPNNKGEVFLAADGDPTLKVAFSTQGDRSGGLMTPDLSLGGLSRVTGPVSGKDLSAAVQAKFDPKAWFGQILDAKLFGAFTLASILDPNVTFDAPAQVPRFMGGAANLVETLLSGLDQLVHDAASLSTGQLQALQNDIDAFSTSVRGGTLPPLPSSVTNLEGSPPGGPGQQAVVRQRVAAIGAAANKLGSDVVAAYAKGEDLPQIGSGRLEWRPKLQADPKSIFSPGAMVLSVEATDALGGGGEGRFTVTAAIEGCSLDLGVIALQFGHIVLTIRDGHKPDVDVAFDGDGVVFKDELAFVQTLRDLIPFAGFSDPPQIDVSPEGISAGFSMGLPDLAVGVFTLQNLSLGAGFLVPFVGPPMGVWFRFCERENPAILTVMCFGGGGFLGVTVNADGLHILEAALEFGAAIAVNFGVAAGGVSAMGGIYFKIEGSDVTLTGYFRLRGEVEALGIVSVSLELYIDLTYESADNKCVGTASISLEIEVAMFSTTIKITATKKFAGAGNDPTFRELMDVQADGTSEDWDLYCGAFA
jgi:hypothetical protein